MLVACGKKQGPDAAAMMMMQVVPVRAVTVAAGDVPLQITAVGNVEALTSVDVKSRVAGQILKVLFTEGQDVRAGQMLFEIDPEPLQRQIAELRANVGKDDALEAQARANVTRDEAQLKQARSAADRGQALAKDGIYSREQTEQVVATADAAQAALVADRAAVESAVASKTADAAKLEETNLQLTYTKIAAPISGRAGAVLIKGGNLIKDNDASLVTILQLSPVFVSFGLPEQMLGEVRQADNARKLEVIATPNGGKTETGKLAFVDNTVDTTTGTVRLKAVFENADRVLWPGQFVSVQAQLRMEHDRVLVPSRAIQSGPDGKYVWVVNSGTTAVAMQAVTVSRLFQVGTGAEQAVVSSGLHGGETVVSDGQMRLAPGVKVRLLEAAPQVSQNRPVPE